MPRSSWKTAFRFLIPVGLGVAFVNCGDELGPSVPVEASFVIGPVLQEISAAGFPVASALIRITRDDESVAAETTVQIDPADTEVDVTVEVSLNSDPETLFLEVQLLDEDGTVVFQSPRESFEASSSGEGTTVGITELTVMGPSAQATSVSILPLQGSLAFQEEAGLQAAVFDDQDGEITGAELRWEALDPARATVLDRLAGTVRGESERGGARIVAQVPQVCTQDGCTGPADTITIDVVAAPAAIDVIAGDAQTAVVGSLVDTQLQFRLLGSDDLPVAGEPIELRVTQGDIFAGGAPAAPGEADAGALALVDTATTDANGEVVADWQLGTMSGPQTGQAILISNTNITASFSATALADAPAALGFAPIPAPITSGVTFSVQVEVQDQFGNVATQDDATDVTLALDPATGSAGAVLGGTLTQTASAGVSTFADLTIDLDGQDYELTASGGGFPVVNSAPFDVAQPGALTLTGGLAFASNRTGTFDLFVTDLEEGIVFPVTELGTASIEDEPDWAPGGMALAATVDNDLWVGTADTLVQVTTGGTSSHPAWSPDGTELAFVNTVDGDADIWRVTVDDPASAAVVVNTTSADQDPDWSPDGSRIVIAREGTGLVVIDPSGGVADETLVTGDVRYPAWSSDSMRIVFSEQTATGYQLRVFDFGTGTATPITDGINESDWHPAWSPDDMIIVFARSDTEGFFNIWATSADGVTEQLVESSAVNDWNPAWVDTLITTGSVPSTVGPNSATNQTATVDAVVADPPSVEVLDASGNPVPDVEVTFAVTDGGGTLTGAVQMTDFVGIATVDSWQLGTASGNNVVTATVTGLPVVTFNATGTPDVADALQVISGNNQTADVGMALADPLVVAVVDQFGNGINGQQVTWSTGFGSLSSVSTFTDGNGEAQVTWTLGANARMQTATAASTGLTSVVFTATGTFPNPTILLTLPSDRIALGGSETLDILLTAPAPVGGLNVDVTSDNTGVVAIGTPGSPVNIVEGDSVGSISLDAVAGGMTTVRANATGYTEGTIGVEVSQQVLSMPTTLNVPFGGTVSLPLQISTPAPPGGVDVTLLSTDPATVAVVTGAVTIAEGTTTANATLSGVAPGPATITGSTADFGSAQTTATTTAEFDILQFSVNINESFGDTLTIRLESGGAAIPAPAGGVQVMMSSNDETCVVVESPVTVPEGLAETTAAVAYGGTAQTTCNTLVFATAPSIVSDSATVNVAPMPGISSFPGPTASGLQRSTSANLGAFNHGGVDVTITSNNPALLLVSPDANTPGAASIDIPVADNTQFINYFTQGVEGQTGTDTLTISAPGFQSTQVEVEVREPGHDLIFVNTNTTSFTPEDPFQVRIGAMNSAGTALESELAVRAGGSTVTATVATTEPAVARLVTAADTGAAVTVEIMPGQARSPGSVATGGVALDPEMAGATDVSATIAGFQATNNSVRTVTVTAPAINAGPTTTGSGLQRGWSASLGASNHGGVDVTIATLTQGLGVVQPDANTPGTDTLVLSIPDGTTFFNFTVAGLEGETGTEDVEISAPGFVPDTVTVTVRDPGVDIIFLSTTTTSLTIDDQFQVRIGAMNAGNTTLEVELPIRAGGSDVTATVMTSDSSVAQLVTMNDSAQTTTVDIAVGQTRSPGSVATGGIALDPLNAGMTTVSATIPGFMPSTGATQVVTVTAPAINQFNLVTGEGLQRLVSGSLGASDHGGVTVTIASLDPGMALFAPDASTVGTDTLMIAVPDGATGFSYFVQGVEGETGLDTFEVSAPGFTPDTSTVDVRTVAIDIIFLTTSTTSLTADDQFQVRIGAMNAAQTFMEAELPLRAGATPLTATVTSSAPTVGTLVTNTLTSDVVTVEIQPELARSPFNVVDGGVAFRPQTAGMTTVSVTAPNFMTVAGSMQEVTVTTPGISVFDALLGVDLYNSHSASLNAPAPVGGVTATVTSSNASFLLVSQFVDSVGTGSIDLFIPEGQSTISFFTQGLAAGLPTLQITAPGYTDGTATVDIRQTGYDIIFLNTTTNAGAGDDPFQIRIGGLNAGNTALDFELPRRPGIGPLTATITSDDTGVGQLVTTAATGGSVMVDIDELLARSPTGVATGGVAFDAVAAGTTTVSVTIPGLTATNNATRVVTVNP